ncbi:hypothetical protein [Flagellimonas flava]|uniref:Uncharacterized protein n=1 Tax=Flagellimonas flava TaxID=570519 RepID=A0A1M5PVJ9_9FLAO|nr:hypothetical protein [Allomuricauda flava]SHH05449.1 hypothetical protein SAMN04488116_3370 [Allomuricauda flava]
MLGLSYNEIGILLGLFALGFLFLIQKRIPNNIKYIWKGAVLCFVLYVIILVFVEIRWYYISEHARSFDLNNNGFVDLHEYNEEALAAMNKMTQDTAKNFACVTVGMLSAAISFSYVLVEFVLIRFKTKK